MSVVTGAMIPETLR